MPMKKKLPSGQNLKNSLWNGFYYLSAVYFFLYFAIFNTGKDEFGQQFLNIFYNIHIEFLILILLLVRVAQVAEVKECLNRFIWFFVLTCYVILVYLEAGKIKRIREIIIFGLIITASQINIKKLIQWILAAYLSVAFVKVFVSLRGLGQPNTWVSPLYTEASFGRGYIETRYEFGFGHPNVCHCAFFCISALILYLLHRNKAKYITAILIFLFNLFLYHYTDSRTGLLIVIGMLIFYFLFPFIRRLKNSAVRVSSYLLLQAVPFAAATFTFIVGYIGPEDSRMAIINKLVTGRLGLMHRTITETPLTFIGHKLPTVCDSHYIHILYNSGIYVFLAYMILHIFTVHYYFKKEQYEVLALIAIFDLYFILEPNMLSMNRNMITYFMIGASAGYYDPPTALTTEKTDDLKPSVGKHRSRLSQN